MLKCWAQRYLLLLLTLFISSCTVLATYNLDNLHGNEDATARFIHARNMQGPSYEQTIKPILENRCVVCHGCYDAPCQLKLSAYEGLERGASKEKVYDGQRLLPANLNRLFVDAQTPQEWRDRQFYPVLNEREPSARANTEAGVLSRMLLLKEKHPLPKTAQLPDSFDFSLNRNQQCPKIEEMASYEKNYPLWGMPYGLPAISADEFITLTQWLKQGAPFDGHPAIADSLLPQIRAWEDFLNQRDNKSRLVSRYIFEHLFIANLYFDQHAQGSGEFFRLVRSQTPSGQAIKIIPTRRPYDDPGSETFYYRLQRVQTTILGKTHLPYALNPERLQRYQELFLQPEYTVKQLPGYKPEIASNPFLAFQDLPVSARYRFMLDEAQFTIMGFIKGPVCRGQVALNVINDQFWVFFVNPDLEDPDSSAEFLASQTQHLRLPAEAGNTAFPLTNWLRYSRLQKQYLEAKTAYLNKLQKNEKFIDLNLIWDGEQTNTNAALTIFRHFDSASVVKGLAGDTPKTAWLIGYPLLERIHYLLVAGFDVYGNLSHQLLTRLYMDFLRMEGEANFLMLLPEKNRQEEREFWYRGVGNNVKEYLDYTQLHFNAHSTIPYKTDKPKTELFTLAANHLGPALDHRYTLADNPTATALKQLSGLKGLPISLLPQVAFLSVNTSSGIEVFTLIHNNAHSNISTLFDESKNRLPEEDTLTVVPGLLGNYPNTFYKVDQQQLDKFISAVKTLRSEEDYQVLLDHYGIRRSDPHFWQHSDLLHELNRKLAPIEAGLFDYNRLENR